MTPWLIEDGILLLKQEDGRLKALTSLFNSPTLINSSPENTPHTEKEIRITVQEKPFVKEGIVSVIGTANIAFSSKSKVTFKYNELTEEALSLELTKDLTSFNGLALPSTVDHLFENLQESLLVTIFKPNQKDSCSISRRLEGRLNLGKKHVDILVRSPDSAQPLFIETTFEEGLGLGDLIPLLDTSNDPHRDLQDVPTNFWPQKSKLEDLITLTELNLEIDPNDEDILTYLAVTLAIDHKHMWTIIPDYLAVGGMWLELDIDYPLGLSRFPSLKVGGEIEVAGGKLDVKARWPDFSIWGELKEGEPIHVGTLLKHFDLFKAGKTTEGMGFTELEIDQLWFKAEPTSSPIQFSFNVDVAHVWSISLSEHKKFEIENVSLLLYYTEGTTATSDITDAKKPLTGANGRFDITIMGKVQIAGVHLYVTADYHTNGGIQFEGGTQTDSEITLATFIDKMGDFYGPINKPHAISDLKIDHLRVSFNTVSKNFTFGCHGELKTNSGQTISAEVNIELSHQGEGQFTYHFSGYLQINDFFFKLQFESDQDSNLLVGALVNKQPIPLQDLIKAISADAINLTPPLTLSFRDVLFATLAPPPKATTNGPDANAQQPSVARKYLFALALDADLNLANLPLVGHLFAGHDPAGIKDLQVLFPTESFSEQDVIAINKQITVMNNTADSGTVSLIPLTPPDTTQTNINIVLNKGFNISGNLNLGIEQLPISTGGSQSAVGGVDQVQMLPSGGQGGQVSPTMSSPVSPPTGNAQWFAIQKQLGPLYFEKVGVRYEKGEIWFLLNANLSLAGLTIALDGLAVSSPLQKFDPRFHLQGLGIDYQDGPLEIGGMFLRQTYKDAKGEPYDEYDGIAILKTEELSLSAIGSYARLDGHPSLFIYAVLDYPLGGPAFFFVTGLSAGFGYNRFLTVPPVEQLLQFPLVSEAVSRAETAPPNSNTVLPLPADGKSNLNNMKNTLAQEMEKLHQYISPQVDQNFLAVGVRFTSFEIIDSFVLVTLAFGGRFELNIIGLTSYATPPGAEEGVPSLVRVELAIKASFLPDEGFLGVRALLTNNSYLFDPACYLVGGMAFYSWFDGPHKGDFALTVGGYHPDFHVPAHYPLVPRLGFLWHYGNQLSIKGGMYFALTGHAIMAGGSLEAVWQDGDLQAWFKTTADFLLSWKPYHYEASVSVDIGGSLTVHAFGTHHITVHLHADLSVWGPKFSGVAHFQIIGIHLSISFGDKKSVPPAIEWPAFRQSFLPQTIYGITVQSGLVKSLKGYELDDKNELVQKAGSTAVHWLLDPKDLALTINSVIPIHSWQLNGELATQFTHSVGVAPMDVRKEYFTSNFEITITNDHFTFEPITKPVPAGLWGNIYAPNVNDSSMVPDAVCGFQVSLKEQADEGIGHAIEKKKLSSDTEIIQDAYQWQPTWGKAGETMAKQTTSQQIESGATDPAKQQALLQSLFSLDDTSFLRHTGKLNASDLFAHPMLVEFKD